MKGSAVDEKSLIEAAWQASRRAYAPYSKFAVGAALATASGRIVTGCNVENASYGLAICAERSAVCRAVGEGERVFLALVVCTPGGAMPCGACRQVLHEFSPDLEITVVDSQKNIRAKHNLRELLPHGFDISTRDIDT